MNSNAANNTGAADIIFFLSEIIKIPVFLKTKKIGRLTDFIIIDKDKIAEITHIVVGRPFGDPDLFIPWQKVKSITKKDISLDLEDIESYAVAPAENAIFLKDYILDKRVLDEEGREVEVVYDVKLVLKNNNLYVTDVDLSKYGLLRRMGLKWLANFIYSLAEKIRDQTISWDYVQPLPEQISGFKGDIKLKVLKEKLSEIPPMDLADILEQLNSPERTAIFNQLDTEHASDTLEELDPNVQRDLIASLEKEKTAQLINEMTPAQAADILSVLPRVEAQVIIKLLNKETAGKVQSILEAQEVKIIDFGVLSYVSFAPDKTVLQARRGYQRLAKSKDVIMYIYILDEQKRLLGVIDLKELLRAEDEVLLKDIMVENIVALNPESTLKEASEIFTRYSLRALPIIDENKKLLGVVPYRDVMTLKHLYLG